MTDTLSDYLESQRLAEEGMTAAIATDLSLEGRDADANVLYEVVDALGGAQ